MATVTKIAQGLKSALTPFSVRTMLPRTGDVWMGSSLRGKHTLPPHATQSSIICQPPKDQAKAHLTLMEQYSAHNYHPLPVVIAEGQGIWVKDVNGKTYADMLGGFAACSFGHSNPRIIQAAKTQLDRITLTTRVFNNDQLGLYFQDLAQLCGMENVLAANGGAEAVETAIKLARKWGYEIKGVPHDQAVILVCTGNFHGRPISITGFSNDPNSRNNFGPYPAGFRHVPFGDAAAVETAMREDKNIVGILFEPIQGEAGVVIPPDGYIKSLRALCTEHNVLMIADEIQSGLGRTGKTFACDHEDVKPDVFILAKGLSGGLFPSSAVVSSRKIFSVIKPGQHGSTFGGNPLAAAVGREVISMLQEGTYQENSRNIGAIFASCVSRFSAIKEVRARGLWLGADLKPGFGTAQEMKEKLMQEGVLCKEAKTSTLRFSPALSMTLDELHWVLERMERVLDRNEN